MAITIKVTGKPGLVLSEMAETITPAMARAVMKGAKYAGGEIARAVVDTFPQGGGMAKGHLARSFLPAKFIASRKGVSAGAISDLVYANIQDQGGTIKPRTVKNLAIPISKEAKTKWPRDWPRDALTLMKSKAGKLLLIDADSKGKPTVHYVLKESVTIQGRRYIDKARKETEKQLDDIIADEIGDAFDNVPGVEPE